MSRANDLNPNDKYIFVEIEKQISLYHEKKSSDDCYCHLHIARSCVRVLIERDNMQHNERLSEIIAKLDQLEVEPGAIASERLCRQKYEIETPKHL